MCFVAHLFERSYSPASIATHISAIAYAHKILGGPNPTDNFLLKKMITGASKLASKPDTRLPITPNILQSIINTAGNLNFSAYQQALFKSIFTLAFFAFLRLGELTVPSHNKHHYVVQLQDVVLSQCHILLTMHSYKHSGSRPPVTLKINQQPPPICPILSLHTYLQMRGRAPGPLFCFPDLRPVTKQFLTNNLTMILKAAGLNPDFYKGHSFRIGAATHAAASGLSNTQIQQMGRWNSSAFNRYIRIDTISIPHSSLLGQSAPAGPSRP